ncbi:hypothetical protein [Streptomyces sp. NPDC047108]|uniref:hypothetical protein n=1 Tax=Streptomyces sp. NPDC047108 TaxID=3155025 RepID=UPI0033CDDA0F
MRTARAFATAAAATALVGLSAPAAVASVSPQWARPGQTVWISDEGRCDLREGATAYSGAFGTVRLRPRGHHLADRAQVFRHARGTYRVTIRCGDGQRYFDRLQVGPTRGAHAGEGGGLGGTTHAQFATGAALVALAAGGGVLALRRRTKGAA